MQRIVDYLKQYIGVISIVFAVCILLTYSLSYFMVNTGNKRAAEMYLGELQYSITIDGSATNVVTAPVGESVIDLTITGIIEINTYYKLLYTYSGTGITVTYFDKTQDTSGVSTTYDLPGDSLTVKGTKKLKLKINNTSTASKAVTFKVSGGYSTNTLSDVEVPSGYNQITLTTQYSNTYFCTTSSTLTSGLEYVYDGLTYKYRWQVNPNSSSGWGVMSVDGWGVKLTNLDSTGAFAGKLCTYINNKPIKSTAYTFYNSQASTINLLYFDTHNVINMKNMFYNTSATSIYNINNINTSSVTNMYAMFYDSKATSLNLSNFNTSKVTDMSYMFDNSSATVLDVSNFDTSNVTDMDFMFATAKSTTLDVSSFNTSKVTDMHGMFYKSDATTIKGLENFNTSSVTNMNSMFEKCQASTLNLSNFDTSNVTDMGYLFRDSAATTINYSSFNTSNVTNMEVMFSGTKLESIDLSNFDTSKVTDMRAMFSFSQATTLNLSSFDTSKVTSMSTMFSSSSATTIIGLEKFNTSKVTDMSYMFNSNKLTSLNLSSFDTSKVTNMESMFSGSKVTLNLSNFDTSNVTNMSYMFSSASSSINLTSFNTSKVTKMNYMFLNSTITTLDLSSFELNSSVTLNGMFNGTAATVGYAKTQTIADKFNDSSVTNIPSTLFFIVKGGKTNAGVYVKNMKPTGLESTARNGLYRFVGTSNNYANMGGVTYRIIGITDNSTINTNVGLKQNQLKLIKATPIGTKAWEADRTTDNPWGSDDNDMYYYLNNTIINNTSYIPTAWKNRISSVNWYIGDAASAGTASSLASLERATTTSSTSKVGLMYITDFYYSNAAGGTNCYSSACKSSWLYSSSYEQWSMTRRGYMNNLGYYAWYIGTDGKAFTERVATTTLYYSPVFYLDQGVAITSGTGTSSNPFILDVNKDTYTVELRLDDKVVGVYEVKKGEDLTATITVSNSVRRKSCDNASITTSERGTVGTVYVTSITGDTICEMYHSLI